MKRLLFILLGVLMLLIGYYQFWFLRLPDRIIPTDKNVFVSPADGVISAVIRWDSTVVQIPKHGRVLDMLTSDIDSEGWMISIEMDITNVHYQRCPISSRHIESKYVNGAFNNALIKENKFGIRLENEHNAMLFETNEGLKYKVVQVAGLVARRIVDSTTPGSDYQTGDLIGLIKLGSQVSLILPKGTIPLVQEGEKVIDGESIIAKTE